MKHTIELYHYIDGILVAEKAKSKTEIKMKMLTSKTENLGNALIAIEQKIDEIMEDVYSKRNRDFGWELFHVMSSGNDNAYDTIHIEKEADESEFDKIYLASVESCLTDFDQESKLVKWFSANGIAG